MFPDGSPGKGLLVLRVANGALMLSDGIAVLAGSAHREPLPLICIASAASLFLLAGLWTPIAGVLAAVAESAILFAGSDHPRSAILLATAGISIAMLGPGVWSVDAILFGRKRLDIHER
jgi:uncharacterized membrane protein YphA (DoxX/SURF4 family)